MLGVPRNVSPWVCVPLCAVILLVCQRHTAWAQASPQSAPAAAPAAGRADTSAGSAPADLAAKNVLILHALESNMPLNVRTDQAIMAALETGGVGLKNQFFEYLDMHRHPGLRHRQNFAEQMRLRHGDRKIDAIITLYPEALQFVLDEGRAIFPDAPIVALYMFPGFEPPRTGRRIVQHVLRNDIAGTFESALRLVPGAQRVYVVGGVHPLDKKNEVHARQDLQPWQGRLDFRYLSDRSLEKMLATVSSAPAKTIVLYLAVSADITGKTYNPRDVAERLSRVATGPVFGLYESLLGHGIVGGSLVSYDGIGTQAGQLALSFLGIGSDPNKIPALLDVPGVPMFDWRQLKRWNLSVDALPKGSMIVNREFTLRDLAYYILGAVAFILAEAILIGVLLVQRRRRLYAERQLEQHRDQLEATVQARTAEMVVAREKAEAANRAKSVFLANMSHELRTPLNSMLGVTQLLERDAEFPPTRKDVLGILSRSGKHLLELIDDVLETSKIEVGRIAVAPASFDLYRFLDELEETMCLRAHGKGLRLAVHRDPELPRYVRSDSRRLRQVLTNLLGNAIRYTEKGQVALSVRFGQGIRATRADRPDSPAGLPSAVRGHVPRRRDAFLGFEVADTGIGIAAEDLERIFEPFVQLNPGRGVSEGAGLGLTLSRGLVALLGGEIAVRSEVGRGTCFAFEIPVEPAEAPDAAAEPVAPRVLGLAAGQPRYRVLVVDDSTDSRSVLRELLEQAGFSVLEAANGREAMDMFVSHQPHLILMDLRMPVMDGYDAVKSMRNAEYGLRNEDGQTHRPFIIAVTAHVTEDGGPSVLGSGFDDVICKPFSAPELFDKIGKHLGVQYVRGVSGVLPGEDLYRDAAALTPTHLAMLPAGWLKEFSQSLRKGRSAQMLTLIDRIRPAHADLAGALAGLVRRHGFDTLLAATEGALKDVSHG